MSINKDASHIPDTLKLEPFPFSVLPHPAALLSGLLPSRFPSKWTGTHLFSSTSHARIKCLVSSRTLDTPQVPVSLLTVRNVNGRWLMHRFPWYVFPPELEQTASTLSRSLGWRKDCVVLSSHFVHVDTSPTRCGPSLTGYLDAHAGIGTFHGSYCIGTVGRVRHYCSHSPPGCPATGRWRERGGEV